MHKFIGSFFFALIGIGCIGLFFLLKDTTLTNCLNVYDWYGNISPELLREFEEETGIHVRYDVYSDNETLEAKLLMGKTGYDIVFPSAVPFAAFQSQTRLFKEIDWTCLDQSLIDPILTQKIKTIDPKNQFLIPYYFGTIGIVYDVDRLSQILGDKFESLKKSWGLLFNPEIVSCLAPYGISLLEESVDVFPVCLMYLKHTDPLALSPIPIKQAYTHLKKIRPFIRRMTSSRFIEDLAAKECVLAQAWSGEAALAVSEAQSVGRNLVYIIPEEGALLWIDCIAIPKDARHIDNVYTFIRFLMRPEIAARITNCIQCPTSIIKSIPFIFPFIRNNPNLYPPNSIMQNLHLNRMPTDKDEIKAATLQNRLWSYIKANRQP